MKTERGNAVKGFKGRWDNNLVIAASSWPCHSLLWVFKAHEIAKILSSNANFTLLPHSCTFSRLCGYPWKLQKLTLNLFLHSRLSSVSCYECYPQN